MKTKGAGGYENARSDAKCKGGSGASSEMGKRWVSGCLVRKTFPDKIFLGERSLLSVLQLAVAKPKLPCLTPLSARRTFRRMNDRISIHPAVCHGKPVIRGTRVLVSTLRGALAGGDSVEIIPEDYPTVTKEDLLAVLSFAKDLSDYQIASYEAVA